MFYTKLFCDYLPDLLTNHIRCSEEDMMHINNLRQPAAAAPQAPPLPQYQPHPLQDATQMGSSFTQAPVYRPGEVPPGQFLTSTPQRNPAPTATGNYSM